MKVTSAQANKLLKKVTEEYEALKLRETQSKNGARASAFKNCIANQKNYADKMQKIKILF